MVARGVRGLNRFKEHMAGLEDSYVVIGGAAYEVLLGDADLEFRATKDVDMVLLVEGRLPEAAGPTRPTAKRRPCGSRRHPCRRRHRSRARARRRRSWRASSTASTAWGCRYHRGSQSSTR